MNKKLTSVFLIFAVLFFVSSCSNGKRGTGVNLDSIKTVDVSSLPKTNYKSMKFKGPYKNDFNDIAKAFKNNNFVLTIIKDEKITDEELSESYKLFHDCTASYGFEHVWPDGWYGSSYRQGINGKKTEDSQELDEQEGKCSKKSGFNALQWQYMQITTNPKNEDHLVLKLKCMIRHKMVPKDYTKDDYMRDFHEASEGKPSEHNLLWKYVNPAQEGNYKEWDKFEACQQNPLDISTFPNKYKWQE